MVTGREQRAQQRRNMTALLEMNRQSRCGLNLLRTWWALRRQARRRRGGSSLSVPAPVLTDSQAYWGSTAEGWADIIVFWDFPGEAAAEAVLEIWERDEVYALRLVGTAPVSDHSFTHTKVTEVHGTFYYLARYRNGGVVGPFSNELAAVVSL